MSPSKCLRCKKVQLKKLINHDLISRESRLILFITIVTVAMIHPIHLFFYISTVLGLHHRMLTVYDIEIL